MSLYSIPILYCYDFRTSPFIQFLGNPLIQKSFTASLPVFMAGIVLAWPSPAMEFISAGHAPLQMTSGQMSWMVACIDIGNFIMTVPVGRLMDRMGRRFAVNMSAPLMFVGWMLILFGDQVRINTT